MFQIYGGSLPSNSLFLLFLDMMFPCDGLMLLCSRIHYIWYIMDICGLWSVSLNPSTLLILKVVQGMVS